MGPDAVHDAASVILLRGHGPETQVLMGQRAATAAFMPSKFVFPGGRVDAVDTITAQALQRTYALSSGPQILGARCRRALQLHLHSDHPTPEQLPDILAAAALRELAEETGLRMARPRPMALRFVFRAITPRGPPRRFDARFFLAHADDFTGHNAGFAGASGELSQLQWLPLAAAQGLNLPFITRVILAEVRHHMLPVAPGNLPPVCAAVPFFDNHGPAARFAWL